MTTVLGLIFSARAGGNLHDLAGRLFSMVSAELPEAKTEIIEIAKRKVHPCNGCEYECLLGKGECPVDDDVLDLWRSALRSDLLVYFVPTYGGLPPATWVAFQQRYHAVFRRGLENNPRGKVSALTVYEPTGTRTGDVSQEAILKNLVGQGRPLVSFEQIVPSNYGLNSLADTLVQNPEVQQRIAAMSRRLIGELLGHELLGPA